MLRKRVLKEREIRPLVVYFDKNIIVEMVSVFFFLRKFLQQNRVSPFLQEKEKKA